MLFDFGENKMDMKKLYTQTMVESIKNSGMWLKEAKILAKKGSKSHSQALLIFSVEELGKAINCWYAVCGLIPYNHPVVDYRAKRKDKLKGIFRNHPLKFATTMGLEMGLRSPELFPDDVANPEIEDPFTDAPAPFVEVLGKIGSFGSWARTRWMYVDIDVDNSQPKVHSPLLDEPADIHAAIEDFELTIRQFKKIARTKKLPTEFVAWIQSAREALIEKDKDFPDNPEWI